MQQGHIRFYFGVITIIYSSFTLQRSMDINDIAHSVTILLVGTLIALWGLRAMPNKEIKNGKF